ncbi:kinetoplast DNA-associated protein [Trypanosoma conorhini]|uniref:Kinetoplast DNA-associated protein n=1 Tax=Trypanosoma conorhini TaxID=83891 RepID=A0A3R7LXD3_9TRYP|nr:kinetoplast DNA-associated protein [Trypanosoma conorhini]RNE95413.1 kinetoplast DNA-associated protein [Trypanosoma conorhini]
MLLGWFAEAALVSRDAGGGATTTDAVTGVQRLAATEADAHRREREECRAEVTREAAQLPLVEAGCTLVAENVRPVVAAATPVGESEHALSDAEPAAAELEGPSQAQPSPSAVADVVLDPTFAEVSRPCSAPGAKKGGDSSAAMTEAATAYLLERAGAAIEAMGEAGDLSYSTLEVKLRRGLLEAVSTPVSRPGEVTEEWRAGLWALAERVAADFIFFASKQKLRGVDESIWHGEAFLTPEEVAARALAAVTPRRCFEDLQPSDLRFLVHHYVELARNGTLNEDVYREARLCENLFERRDENVASTLPPPVCRGGSARKIGASSGGRSALAVNQRRAGLTQLVLGHALDNLLEDTVADTARWVASLVAT